MGLHGKNLMIVSAVHISLPPGMGCFSMLLLAEELHYFESQASSPHLRKLTSVLFCLSSSTSLA